MKKNKILNSTFISLTILGFTSSLNNVWANKNLNKFSSEQKDYVIRYVEAVNSNDLQMLKVLTHKSYQNCINSTNQDYYDFIFQKSLKRNIPKDYKVSIEQLTDEAVTREMNGAKKIALPYPIRPTHKMQIYFNKSEYSFVTIVRNLTSVDGKYYEISGCPSDKMIKKFREIKIKKEKNRKRAELLFHKLKDPFLLELRQLLKEGKKISAWRKYSEKTGESLSMSKEVLSHIKIE